ncbi:FkbM family methyltransferase [Pseudoxanthomonas sp.]|uniref:FkbM family methyltransferase n=1 Tax=Pseudoxanthomonas sp. TaxID=1871049 RepID=UPI0026366F4C|nr:FkbM family methyltransferase [Pseudoxanthomonas sp.]WDS35635.1 MAG: FkbM family methyltransferase [Pseudoxanthomonas sp.]
MNFVSYAQNYEDVMLWRALREFGKGFYIDVGAQDPQEFSVTKAFYERGWRGINIEPSRRWLGKLEVQRPHDLNLGVAASSEKGTLRFYDVKDTGLSTANPEYAQRHVDAGFAVDEVDVPCETLDDICAAHDVGDVHFLKIDCEGGEEDVLRGFSLEKVRPWVILVEATEPLSEKPAYEPWEKLLTGRSYHFIYDDGLNRFYIADERSDLDVAFSHPPNVFDEFIRVSEYELDAVRNEGQAAVFERDQWRDTAKFLQAENERREAALVEHRRLLEQGSSSESSERNGFLETIAFLRAENERREAALVEHRRLLEQGSSSESSERNGFLETIGFLRAENERREAALVEHRRLLEQGSSSESSERNGFFGDDCVFAGRERAS